MYVVTLIHYFFYNLRPSSNAIPHMSWVKFNELSSCEVQCWVNIKRLIVFGYRHSSCLGQPGTAVVDLHLFSVNLHIGLSKVAGCQPISLLTWLVLAGYSAWHFFTGGVFKIKYCWTGLLLWQLSHLLQTFLTTLLHMRQTKCINFLMTFTEMLLLSLLKYFGWNKDWHLKQFS